MLTRISLGAFALLAIAAVILIVGVGEDARMVEKEASFAGRSIENGATIFMDACTGCHGIQGEGIPGVAPALNAKAFFSTRLEEVGWAGSQRDFIESTVSAGRPVGSGQYSAVMPTWGQSYGGPLRPDQVHDVASYILNWEEMALQKAKAPAAVQPTPLPEGASPLEIGQAVYAAQGCAGCHGEPGGTGLIGPNLGGVATRAADRVPGQSAEEYIHTSIVQPNAFVVPDCPAGACPANVMPQTYEASLSEAELDGLVQYLLTLE